MKTFFFVYILFVLLRILLFPLFLSIPLFAWAISYFLDLVDYGAALRGGITYRTYQSADKILDVIFRIYMLISVYYLQFPFAWIFLVLFFIRSLGDVLYFKTRNERHYFLFPNVMEFFYPLYLLWLAFGRATPYSFTLLGGCLFISIVFKIVHEYALHIHNWIDPLSLTYIKDHPEHGRALRK